MIDGKTISDLRIRLLTMRVEESKQKDTRTGTRDLFGIAALFPETSDHVFYGVFSPVIGELLAMSDGFRKLQRVREFCRDLQNGGKGFEHGQGFDPRRALDAVCEEVERIFQQFEELESAAKAAEEVSAQ
jgi:hypothetical protein